MENRAQYLHALLNAVHIYALPPKFLKNQLLSCPILSKVLPCRLSSLDAVRREGGRQIFTLKNKNKGHAPSHMLFEHFHFLRLASLCVCVCVSSVLQANACKDFLSKIFQEMTVRMVPPAPIRGTQLIYVAGGYLSLLYLSSVSLLESMHLQIFVFRFYPWKRRRK